MSGGSEVTVNGVVTGALSISASGARVIALAGKADALNLELSGGSELRAPELNVGSLEVEASGGGGATVHVSGAVHGTLSGGTELKVGPDARRRSA